MSEYIPDNDPCCFCQKSLAYRVKMTNVSSPLPKCFIYMDIEKKCHFECYVQECVRRMETDDLSKR